MADITAGRISVVASLDASGMQQGEKQAEESLKELEKSIEDATASTKSLEEGLAEATNAVDTKAVEDVSDAWKDTGEALEEVVEELGRYIDAQGDANKEAGESEKKHQSFKQRLKEVKQALYELEEAGESGSDAYRKLAREAGDLEDKMADVNAMTRHLASDTMKLDEIMAAANFGAGAFSVAEGAMEAFGAESANVEEAQRKLQAAMSLTTGLQSLQNALQKQSALMLGIQRVQTLALAKAKQMEAKGTWAAVAAQKALNLVAKANPIGLLISAVVALGAALLAMGRSARDAEDKLQSLDRASRRMSDTLSEIDARSNAATKLAEAAGATAVEVQNLRMQYAKMAREEAAAELNAAAASAESVKGKKNIEKAQEKLIEMQEQYNEAVKKEREENLNYRAAVIQQHRDEQKQAQQKAEERRKEREQQRREEQQKQEELTKLEKDAEEQRNKMRRDMATDAIKEEREREKQRILDSADDQAKELQKKIDEASAKGASGTAIQALMDQQAMVREKARREIASKQEEWAKEDQQKQQEADAKILADRKHAIELELKAVEQGTKEEVRLLMEKLAIEREIELEEDRLATGGANADRINRKYEKQLRDLQGLNKGWKDYVGYANEAVNYVGNIGDAMQQLEGSAGALGKTMSEVADVASGVLSNLASGNIFGAVASGVTTILTKVINYYAKVKEAQEEAAKRTRELRTEQELLQLQMNDTRAFRDDLFGDMSRAAENAADAVRKLRQRLHELAEEEAKRNFDNLARGWKKKFGSYESLMQDTYDPSEWSSMTRSELEDFRAALNAIVSRSEDVVDTSTYELILQYLDVYIDDLDRIEQGIEQIFGGLADDAVDAITKAIRTGADSWEDFRKAGSKAIESLGEEMMYSLFLEGRFATLKSNLAKIQEDEALGADEKTRLMTEEMRDFYATIGENMEQAREWGEQFKQLAADNGFNVFGNESAGGISGAIQTVTEQTASVIAGQMNAIRTNQVDTMAIVRQQLATLNGIKGDTAYLRSIDQRLSRIEGAQTFTARL